MSEQIKTGGAAFPINDLSVNNATGEAIQHQYVEPGMSLRDYFAAKAMQGIAAHPDTWGLDAPQIANRAYLLAAAMLRAREA